MENSALATGMQKVSFHSNPKESESESEAAQSCLTLSDPMDCRLPGSPIHGIFQAKVLDGMPLPSPIPKQGNAKECSNYCTIAPFSHASKVMLKIFQARLQ